MTIEKARYWAENMTELSKNDRLWLNNPVIMQGVGLAPMVVAATSVLRSITAKVMPVRRPLGMATMDCVKATAVR